MKRLSALLIVSILLTASKAPEPQDGNYAAAAAFVEKNERLEDLARETDLALEALVRSAAGHLRAKGYAADAVRIHEEYEANFKRAVFQMTQMQPTDIGDHRPLSVWLAAWYDRLEDLLGPKVMEVSRLKDIKTFNFAIPVVFNPTGDPLFPPVVPWGEDEYRLHFVPFAGAVSFWLTTVSCSAASWGLGWVTYVCSYAGWGVEYVVMKRFAPRWSDRIYERANPTNF